MIVQYGGQTPLKTGARSGSGRRTDYRHQSGLDRPAEDRERFQQLVEKLGLRQPPNRTATDPEQAVALAEGGVSTGGASIYVLGGRAMEIVYDKEDLRRYMREAVSVSNDSPVLLNHFSE